MDSRCRQLARASSQCSSLANGGEYWEAGSQHLIKWLRVCDCQFTGVKLAYSLNNGVDWILIDSVDNEGSYSWQVPVTCVVSPGWFEVQRVPCMVRICSGDGSNCDISDKKFTIYKSANASVQPQAKKAVPEGCSLANYPNPFNPSTEIMFNLNRPSNVRLDIFNIIGQKVAAVVDEYRQAGTNRVMWNGTSDDGTPLSSGMYFGKIRSDEYEECIKMLLVK